MPTRQTSSSGRPKSPRIQVVLPEDLCARLSALANSESRTVSNMAKVLIQQGVERMERQLAGQFSASPPSVTPGPSPTPTPTPTAVPAITAAPTPIADGHSAAQADSADIRAALEQRQQQVPRPLRRGPRRVRLQRPPL